MAESNSRKTREDIEKLKRDWESDPCWDIYDTEGYEEYRDELVTFQRECEAKWEKRRQDERAKLASLICPLVPDGAKCSLEKCAWWCDYQDACAIKVIATSATRLDDIAERRD